MYGNKIVFDWDMYIPTHLLIFADSPFGTMLDHKIIPSARHFLNKGSLYKGFWRLFDPFFRLLECSRVFSERGPVYVVFVGSFLQLF